MHTPHFKLAAGAVAAVLLAACATTPPPPTDALQAAEMAIRHAEEARVADYASLELTTAREKLTAARDAAQKDDKDSMVLSRKLAEESRADAELATAKSETARAQAANTEVLRSIQTLQQEIQHNAKTGGGQ